MAGTVSCNHSLVFFLVLLSTIIVSDGATPCGKCGGMEVPYPFSTSSECGHPLYPLQCNPELGRLHLQAVSGNYTVQYINSSSLTFVIDTGAFIGDSCTTYDSVSTSHGFTLDQSGPFFLSPNNVVLLLNASNMLLFTPLKCKDASPCVKALTVFPQKSCRASMCCSFESRNSVVFKYGFPVFGQETGYTSLVNWVNGSNPSSWRFGLELAWEKPAEPPCHNQSQCGNFSSCSAMPALSSSVSFPMACLCFHGYRWNSSSGICIQEPFCVRHSRSLVCHTAKYVAGLMVGLVGLVGVTVTSAWVYKKNNDAMRARSKLVKERTIILAANSGGKSARLFGNREMKRATRGFSRDCVLGCGGFGEVYKGILDDGTVVAIKSAKLGNIKSTEQVLNEVRVLSQVNHRNLVRLLGCCVDSELPLLVYEYVPNGNLFDHLHDPGATPPLRWKTRLMIASKSAEGLAYLHSAAYPPIYHRDVKSSNILLDKCMNARVADFGLSRLAEPDLTHVSTCAQGTLGYLDPEYYRNYQLTDKSDVYSFGVVLLELVTSQRAIDFGRSQDDVNLAVMVQSRHEEYRLDDVLDPFLVEEAKLGSKGGSHSAFNTSGDAQNDCTGQPTLGTVTTEDVLQSMRNVLLLALRCLQENRLERPSMKEVAEELQCIVSLLNCW